MQTPLRCSLSEKNMDADGAGDQVNDQVNAQVNAQVNDQVNAHLT